MLYLLRIVFVVEGVNEVEDTVVMSILQIRKLRLRSSILFKAVFKDLYGLHSGERKILWVLAWLI